MEKMKHQPAGFESSTCRPCDRAAVNHHGGVVMHTAPRAYKSNVLKAESGVNILRILLAMIVILTTYRLPHRLR